MNCSSICRLLLCSYIIIFLLLMHTYIAASQMHPPKATTRNCSNSYSVLQYPVTTNNILNNPPRPARCSC